jgi:PD-(D/E)XK nuclease superfamily protein
MPSSSSRRPPAPDPKTARQHELNTKRRGELSELAFAHKAAQEGFGICKPYGDSERFDFVLISRDWPEGDKLWRIQVKSTATLIAGFYHINAHRRTTGRVTPYKPTEVDFLVAHIIPDDSWFIFPIQVLAQCTSPSFRPKKSRKKGIYEAYREAWRLLRPPQ